MLIVLSILILSNLNAQAQTFTFESNELKKIELRKGIPFFKDSLSFESLYQYLLEMEENNVPKSMGRSDEQPCESLNPVLSSFESLKGYESLRKVQVLTECEELERASNPEEISEPVIGDPVLASLFNAKGQLWIDETIFYFKSSDRVFVIDNNDISAIDDIDNNRYFGNTNITEFGGDEGKADFEFIVQDNNTVAFEFTGVQQDGQDIHWEFGDGHTGIGNSINHNYSSSGNYTVCASVVAMENGQQITIDQSCKQISLDDEEALCFFKINKNQTEDGKFCFSLQGFLGMQAVTANWNFGDGSTSTELAPCHDYYCNKTYNLSVSGESSTGCTFNRNKLINVTSFDCCDALASKTQTVLFGQYMLKVKLHQLPLPIIGRTIVSSRHYKRRNNKYKRSKALIKNTINGNVYLSDEQNCKCEHPIYMNQVEQKYKSWLITNYKVGKYFQAKREDPWYGKVYINGTLRFTGAVNASCN